MKLGMFEDKPIKNISSKNLTVSPYVYTAGGTVYLNHLTATERTATTAKSIGFGVEILENDEYFFEKNISAKVEYSKNWATGNIEDVSSVRLNREHLLVTMAMDFSCRRINKYRTLGKWS